MPSYTTKRAGRPRKKPADLEVVVEEKPEIEKLSKEEWLQTLRDFPFFCEKMLGIELNNAQRKVIKEVWPYILAKEFPFRMLLLAGNQAGKTCLAACLCLWFAYTKYTFLPHTFVGAEWRKLEYAIAVIAPLRSLTRAMFHSILKIVNGKYLIAPRIDRGETEYRFNECRIKGFVYRYTKTEAEGFGSIPTMFCANGATIEYFTTYGSKGDTIQGSNYYFMLYDEFGRSDSLHDELPDLYNRLQTTRGGLMALTTPSEKHPNAIQFIDELLRKPQHRFKSFRFSSLDNEFKRHEDIYASVSGLSKWEQDQIIHGHLVPPRASFFPPEKITDVFVPTADLPPTKPIVAGRRYAMGLDTAMVADRIASYVLDVSERPYRVIAKHAVRGKEKKVQEHVSDLTDIYTRFPISSLEVVIDVTNEAGHIWVNLLEPLNPVPFRFGLEKGTQINTKVDMLTTLRQCIENNDIILDDEDYKLKRQLTNYKIDDDKLETDLVMALGLAVYYPYKEYLEGLQVEQSASAVERF